MARFDRRGVLDPSSNPILFSPDRKYFAVITSRGSLETNEIESTVWVFASEQVREFLLAIGKTLPPSPRAVARFSAIPNVDYLTSYEPIASNLRWLPDSGNLLALVKNSNKQRQLFSVDRLSGRARLITAPGYDVFQFESRPGVVVYRAAPQDGLQSVAGSPVPVARSVTGLPLGKILFPERQRFAQYSELRVVREGRDLAVTNPATKRPIRLLNSIQVPEKNPMSISPDGGKVVVLLPSEKIQKSWEFFEPEPTLPGLRLHADDPAAIADSNWGRPLEYSLVDLRTGVVKSLLNAPNGDALGYGDRSRAIWSFDGKKLLLTNTFLSLDGVADSERGERQRPCAAAIVGIVTGASDCILSSRGQNSRVLDVSFGASSDEVVIRSMPPTPTAAPGSERFTYQNGRWLPNKVDARESAPSLYVDKKVACSSTDPHDLFIEIKQDLNTPPSLWASDCSSDASKLLWNPNPWLATLELGDASVFQWKDKGGYQWAGGLVKPPNYVAGRRYPLVIQTHGFLSTEFLTDGSYTTAFAARPLAAAGFVVLQMPLNPTHIATAQEVPDQILGFEAAIEKLASDGLIDRDKVGIIGFSRTCYHVESALIEKPGLFAAATKADGDDESYVEEMLFAVGESNHENETIYGSTPFGPGLAAWVDRAPAFHVDRINVPLRVEAVGPTSILIVWEAYSSLWQQHKPVDLIYFPTGQHILQKPLERLASQQGNVDWFRFWLKGEEDPDPKKETQYAQWRKLRK